MDETNQRSIFVGMQILQEQKWSKDQIVVIEGQRIKAIVPATMIEHHLPAKMHRFPENHFLVPGFIDLHVHGAKGKDVMDGTEEALIGISNALASEGVTGFLATTMSAKDEHIEKVLATVAKTIDQKNRTSILGVHLEGPFIAKKKQGAQLVVERMPDSALVQKWQNIAQGTIKIVTLAPELTDALQLIKTLRKMNVLVSIGHTNATYEEACAAIAAGCTQATHLFNAMRGFHQREPGAIGAILLSDKVKVELIVDGVHLHPAVVNLAYHIKHKDHLILITDAMRAKCLGDGRYELGGQTVEVKDGIVALPDGTLAGSILRMPEAVKNMERFTHCTLFDAIEMATINPARVLGLDERKGTITVGKDADLVVLNPDFGPVMTMREGQIIYPL